MGLAASQGRYLCLTARNSDLIHEAQQISQQRLNLATETQEIAENYSEAMNNTILQVTTPEGGTQQLSYDIITSQDAMSGLCMRIVDTNGNVVIPSKSQYLSVSSTDENGNQSSVSISSASEFISTYMSDLTADVTDEMSSWSLSKLANYYNSNYSKSSGNTVSVENTYAYLDNEDGNTSYTYDENCTDPEYLQSMLTSGEWLLEQAASTTNEDSGWESIVWQGSSAISEVYDTSDDAAAEAEYESETKALEKRDKILELRLEQVETEQSSVETELESVKQIIDKNIEDSFKTFA